MVETVTKTRMEAVEKEVFLCDGCGQEIEDNEQLVTVAVDVYDPDEDKMGSGLTYHRRRGFCQYCAKSLFDYERPRTEAGRKYLSPVFENAPDDDWFAKIGYYTTVIGTLVIVGMLMLLLPFP